MFIVLPNELHIGPMTKYCISTAFDNSASPRIEGKHHSSTWFVPFGHGFLTGVSNNFDLLGCSMALRVQLILGCRVPMDVSFLSHKDADSKGLEFLSDGDHVKVVHVECTHVFGNYPEAGGELGDNPNVAPWVIVARQVQSHLLGCRTFLCGWNLCQ